MSFSERVLRSDEKAIYTLRELYRKYGYSQFKVSKFEEYDLYAHNKSFLVSDKVLAFTDTNGKLMALKPDVTLSIIKNILSEENTVNKLYYNENVYRTTSDSNGFKEIMQTGLECIGNITSYDECEVVMLAAKSLESISEDYILDLSHMGFIDGLFEAANIDTADRGSMLELMESKNIGSLKQLCELCGLGEEYTERLCLLAEMYMPLDKALVEIKGVVANEKMARAYDELRDICDTMRIYGVSDKLYLDFSVVNDQNYYDGIIFKGFINNIPDSVLSGGRYDRLLIRLGKNASAIGFAVYLDRLERFNSEQESYDVDAMLIYESDADKKQIIDAVRLLSSGGKTVLAATAPASSVRYRQLLKIKNGGIEILEAND